MITLLQYYLPDWAIYLSGGVFVLMLLVTAGIAIGKSGRHPIWALLLLLPYGQILAFWLWAYKAWPARDGQVRRVSSDRE